MRKFKLLSGVMCAALVFAMPLACAETPSGMTTQIAAPPAAEMPTSNSAVRERAADCRGWCSFVEAFTREEPQKPQSTFDKVFIGVMFVFVMLYAMGDYLLLFFALLIAIWRAGDDDGDDPAPEKPRPPPSDPGFLRLKRELTASSGATTRVS